MKIETIVFGASGFVGTYLDEYLTNHLRIDTVYLTRKNKNKNFLYGDIRNRCLFDTLGLTLKDVQQCINVATFQPVYSKDGINDNTRYVEVNTIGFINIMNYCIANNIQKLIHLISHRSVISSEGVITETSHYNNIYDNEFSEFAVSEMAAVEMAKCYEAKYGLRTIILRVPSIIGYGPHLEGYRNGKPYKTGLLTFIEKAIHELPLVVYGDPLVGRDVVYVKDVCFAITKSMASENAKGVYNISSGRILTLEEEAETIVDVFCDKDRKSAIIYDATKSNDIEPCLYDIQKAKKDMDWEPVYADFRDMMVDFKNEMLKEDKHKLFQERRNDLYKWMD